MKKILGLVLLLGIGYTANATELILAKAPTKMAADDATVGINFFHGTWQEALAIAQEENKLIFLDAYAAWCGPCKMMARTTFKEKEVGDFFNANFINVKMDMEKHAEGPRLSNDLYLTAYPTLYFLNHTEKPVYKTLGFLDAEKLISEGKKALKI
ncbi:MAG: thioredoxin 1 [Crocinitomix sp.]|jgi:thioredoxin 1